MTRLRFLAWTLSSLALVALAAAPGACSSDGSQSPSGGAPDGGDGGVSDGATHAPTDGSIQALGKWCMDEQARLLDEWSKDPSAPPPVFDDEIGKEQLAAAPAVYASGASSIPLSPSKCTQLLVKREGGKVVEETLVRAPFRVDYDPAKMELVYIPSSIAHWTYTDAGLGFAGDYDGDGFDEARLKVTYEQGAVLEEHAPAGDVVLSRTTSTLDESKSLVTVVTEEQVDGALKVTRSVTASMLQKACNPAQPKPPPPKPGPVAPWNGPTRACSDAERTQISSLVSTALQKGSGCLYAAGMQAQSDQVLKGYIRSEVKFDCIDGDPGFWAANDGGYAQVFPGKQRFIVNSALFSQPQAFQEGTIGHELFHLFDVHDPDLEASADGAQLALTDPVYACEYLCFGSKPTTCHLAACQQKKVSTSWKGKYCTGTVKADDVSKIERARGDGVSISSCGTGHQVGALCPSAGGGSQVQFCTTEAECNAACGGSGCKSYSLSCLPDCR